MSFLYPRTITISRPGAQPSAVGFQSYAPSDDPALETAVLFMVPASIQLRGKQGTNPVGLPADAPQAEWRVFIPRAYAGVGTVVEKDIVTDDIGDRYQVNAAYWNSLGYALTATKLQA